MADGGEGRGTGLMRRYWCGGCSSSSLQLTAAAAATSPTVPGRDGLVVLVVVVRRGWDSLVAREPASQCRPHSPTHAGLRGAVRSGARLPNGWPGGRCP